MNRFHIVAAAGALAGVALFAGTLALGSEKFAKQEGLACTVCHDKPGSKLLTDKGKYYESMHTLAGFDDLEATFGACTSCHVAKPGSKKLTPQGKKFLDLVRDMDGLKDWMKQNHPAPPAPRGGE